MSPQTKKSPASLTRRQVRQYVKSRGVICPFCQSPEIEGTGHSNSDADWHENEVTCHDCGAMWNDIYLLSDVSVVASPSKPHSADRAKIQGAIAATVQQHHT